MIYLHPRFLFLRESCFLAILVPEFPIARFHSACWELDHTEPVQSLLLGLVVSPCFLHLRLLRDEDKRISILLVYGLASFSFLDSLFLKGTCSTYVLFESIFDI